MNIMLGADPEVFYREGGNLVSAFGIIKGDKKNPYQVENGAVQVDGMALEFNITPASSVGEWVFNLNSVLEQLRDMVEGELEIEPIAEFGYEYIEAQPPEAKALGCDPDFNAYTGMANPSPDVKAPFRTGAGHVHIGFCEDVVADSLDHKEVCEMLVRQLDVRLGLMSLLLDGCEKRRELYGKAGAYRPKTYGVEYRVLSNFWLKSQALMEWVFDTVMQAIGELESGQRWYDKYPETPDIINGSDIKAARAIIEAEGWDIPYV